MLPPTDPFYHSLKLIVEGRCPPDILLPTNETADSPRESPLTFHDRHLAKDLTLENIVALPSMTQSLSKLCDSAIENFLKEGYKFRPYGSDLVPGIAPSPPDTAEEACSFYQWQIYPVCQNMVSKLLFHPAFREWHSVFVFDSDSSTDTPFATHGWLKISYGANTQSLHLDDNLNAALDPPLKDKLKDLARRYPALAIWQIFGRSPISIGLLKSVGKGRKFPWEASRTGGAKTNAKTSRPVDANMGVLSKIFPKNRQHGRSPPFALSTSLHPILDPSIRPSTSGRRRNAYRADFCHYIQRAWVRAAIDDSTFIIFNCGSHERIGIRHRETQTLYLSDPIDTVRVGYRRHHIGLYLAIVQDALERQKISKNQEAATAGLKRPQHCLEDKEELVPKRRKISSLLPPEDLETVARALSTRAVALIHLDYSVYRSPIPSSFIRVGSCCVPGLFNQHPLEKVKERYTPADSFSLILGEPTGKGAVGVVHPASLEITLSSGRALFHQLLVKFAFAPEQRDRLRREYGSYATLARKGVIKGIVGVHGLFEDFETGTLALIMEDGGQTLRQREAERTNTKEPEQVSTTEEEREAFLAVLNSLHKAGVRHRDIRADNMVVHPVTHQVSLIDFDCADEKLTEKTLAKELKCINDVLDGSYRGQVYYSASPDPLPSDVSDPDEDSTPIRPAPYKYKPPPLDYSSSPTPDDDERPSRA